MSNPIDSYIEATRLKKEISRINQDSIYESMFDIIRVSFNLNNLEMRTICSTNANCEIVNINGNLFLIYDIYFGWILDILNRLYYRSDDSNDFITFAYKLLAERFQIVCKPLVGICFATLFKDRITISKIFSQYNDGEKWLKNTIIQEWFVILHELIHYIIKTSNDSKHIVKKTQDMIEGMLEEDYHYIRRHYFFDKGLKDMYKIYKKVLTNNYKLAEEICCDDLATKNIIEFSKELLKLNMLETFENTHLALRHLRFLSYINHISILYENKINDNDLKQDKLFQELYWEHELRFYFHRRLTAFFQSESDKNLWDTISNISININKSYSKICPWDQLSDEVFIRLRKIISTYKSQFSNNQILTTNELNEKISYYTRLKGLK